MVSSYTILKKKEYLEMTVEGTYDYWEFLEYPRYIKNSCEEHRCSRMLIDVTPVKAEEVSLIELFFLGEQIAKVIGEKIMIALIWKRESLSDFLVDVATNRHANLKVFDDPKMARYWLTQKY
ncbi:hypothetical protein SAMN06265375_104174 [Muriicola jejuensis]|uniref:STAS/SEC14 domain-containing protein n=1 Tax=Muriicola jejuensis TaxID=504488 RepID=A0A6P0UD51_9FLAO|nr:hypothetical protein [Muriicola jejuensis]NER11184.1 hypothetical protein [Muriicola jejuensis]SMP24198.1 hypothetical protein SAMN06265375_104174 [Muriicola jejuensis]